MEYEAVLTDDAGGAVWRGRLAELEPGYAAELVFFGGNYYVRPAEMKGSEGPVTYGLVDAEGVQRLRDAGFIEAEEGCDDKGYAS